MGDVFFAQQNFGMAFVEYGKALKANPTRTAVRRKLGYLMLKKGFPADALSEFNAILEKDPRHVQALEGKATALLQLNRLTEAEETLSTAVTNDPKLWQAHALLGKVYDRQKLYDRAITAYGQAIAINPKAGPIYGNLGASLYLTGKYKESTEALLKAINQDASDSKTYNTLGLSLFKLKMYPEALEAFKKGSDEGTAHNGLGMLYLKDKNYEKAVESFEKAIALKPVYYESAHIGLQRAKAALEAQQRTP